MKRLVSKAAVLLFLSSTAFAGPLTNAVQNGDLDAVAQLLDDGVDPNETDIATPLHWAAINSHKEIVELLISHGAASDIKVSVLDTPLHAVVRFGDVDTLKTLLDAGTNPETLNSAGLSPLVVAIVEQRPEATIALIDGGADVNAANIPKTETGFGRGALTALHIARHQDLSDFVDLLLTAGAKAHETLDSKEMMRAADPARGYHLARSQCGACHLIDAGEATLNDSTAGPSLIGVFTSGVAAKKDFEYSSALVEYGGIWTRDRLYSYILKPRLIVPGTQMDLRPVITPQMAADMVSYFEVANEDGVVPYPSICPNRGSEVEQLIECICVPPIGKGPLVSVKGSGPYSWESHVCLSAVHAGAISRDGGMVRVFPSPPQAEFAGTLANSVYSVSRGSSKRATFRVEPFLVEPSD